MRTFLEWATLQSILVETYFSFDPKRYDELFDQELEKLIARVRDPARLNPLEAMRGTKWTGYIATALRSSGYREYRAWREAVHEVAVKLLLGKLFTGYDETRHGPMLLHFKQSVWNIIRNLVAKEQTRRRRLPSVPAEQGYEVPSTPDQDEQIIHAFRRLVRTRLGDVAFAVLDARLNGEKTESLVGLKELGSPSRNAIGRVVTQVKELAREFAASLGDSELLRQIKKAMAAAEAAVEKRKAMVAARRVAVA